MNSKGAPTEADAPLDNEGPTTTYLSVTVSPGRHWFPPWNRRSPALRGRGFSMRNAQERPFFFRTKFKKGHA